MEEIKQLFDEIEKTYKQALKMEDNTWKFGVLDGLLSVLDIFHQKYGFDLTEEDDA